MFKILFVCTGNTCRSAMAEALFHSLINENKAFKCSIGVASAGLYAYPDDPANSMAIEVMAKEFGINLTKHRARILEDGDVSGADLILVMTKHHQDMMLEIYPEAADKVFTVREYIMADDRNEDISDPFGMDYETYKACAYEIAALLPEVIDKVFDNEL